MRQLIVSCLCATALFAASSFFVAADQACYNNYEEEAASCSATYNNAIAVAATSQANCAAISQWYECISEASRCDVNLISNWRTASDNEDIRANWTNFNCTVSFGDLGTARSALVWGDPHYILFNGTYASCQNPGGLVAAGNWWAVRTYHDQASEDEDSMIITQIQVDIMHPAYPADSSTFYFSLDELPEAGTWSVGGDEGNALVVTESTVTISGMGLKVFANRKSGHFELGIVAKSVFAGDALTGCPEYYNPALRRQFDVAAIPAECQSLDARYQEGCAFDLARTNASWAAAVAQAASDFASGDLADEVDAQNGKSGSGAALRTAAFALFIAGATLLCLF